MEAVELHVVTEDRAETIQELAEFCERRGYHVIRLFWRNIEVEEEEAAAG